jgi:hypothetical protein
MLISDSDDNSLLQEEEVQNLQVIDEFTVEGEHFQQDKLTGPVLQEEEEDDSLIIIQAPVTVTSKIMIGGIEYESHTAKKTVSNMAEQLVYTKGDRDALSTYEADLVQERYQKSA